MAGSGPGGGSTCAIGGSGSRTATPPPGHGSVIGVALGLAVLGAWPDRAAAGPPAGGLVEVAVSPGDDGFTAVAADPHDQRRLWAASGSLVLASDDGGRTWQERFRLPGIGAAGSGGAGFGAAGFDEAGFDAAGLEAAVSDAAGRAPPHGATGGAGPAAIDAGLEDEDPEAPSLAPAGERSGSAPWASTSGRPAGRVRIHGLRVGPDGLWIAAEEGAYRWSDAGHGPSLERFTVPGGAAALAVAPDPVRPAAAWLATATGLLQVDGALVRRATGAVGTTPARDVDAVRVGAGSAVAVASAAGLFLSADGGRTFAGPLAVGAVGGAVAAVRLDPDGGGLALSTDGTAARLGPGGEGEPLVLAGLGRAVRRLHVAEEETARRAWIATGEGMFLVGADGTAVPALLPTADVRDVVTPAGSPDRPLVATDRGLFLAAGEDLRRRPVVPDAPRAARRPAEGATGAGVPLSRLARFAEAHLGLRGLEARGRLRWAPLLPGVDASWTGGPAGSAGARDTWAVVARWDLARLFGGDDLAASAAERRLHRWRRSLALRLEQALRARRRLLAAAEAGTGDAVEDALSLLAVDEQVARLDGLTGGRFSSARTGPGSDTPRRFP